MIRRGLFIVVLALAACGDQELLLEGERLDVRGNPVPIETVNRAAPLALPSATSNASWTHVGGNTRHQIVHPALGQSLSVAWQVPIGKGNGRKHRITADPVVSAGRVFTLDSQATVSATSTSGERIWSRDLTPPTDRSSDASGGGLAVDGDTVYVTTGYGE